MLWTPAAMRARKDQLRKEMRERRLALDPAFARSQAERAAQHLLALPGCGVANVVAVYSPVRGELDTAPAVAALRAAGKQVVYPRMVPGARVLAFHGVASGGELSPNRLGIPEPPAEAPEVPTRDIDLILVPGLAFSRGGARLGWGHGYYDTTLRAADHALRVGFAYEFQVVDGVPESADDEPVDLVVTESEAHRTGARPPQHLWRVR